ncbi:unnamed protein product [Ilex paraguariensis]|uniref:Olee1-like protein n=1 Tax=Ilex paraguariensis TaxID=185542 RepID=A0ABC8RT47_9AQUA
MAKTVQTAILFTTALCFFSLIGIVQCRDAHFFVEGQVYCDPCRAQFMTRLSEFMPGAKVRLECRANEGGQLTYSIEGVTDKSGTYSLPVEGEHEEDICEILLVKSGKPECSESGPKGWQREAARITLTVNSGIASEVRHANPLGFLTKEAKPECSEVFKELNMIPPEI